MFCEVELRIGARTAGIWGGCEMSRRESGRFLDFRGSGTSSVPNVPTGLLLVNLGTPDAPTTSAVRQYLREFLSDPRVIDINPVGRALLLNVDHLAHATRQERDAYRQMWDAERGSPLLAHSRDLAAGVAAELGDGLAASSSAMRYGAARRSPTRSGKLARTCDRMVVAAAVPAVRRVVDAAATARDPRARGRERDRRRRLILFARRSTPRPAFSDALARSRRPALAAAQPDHVLISFHGLPERQILRCDPTGRTASSRPMAAAERLAKNRRCYRAQCFATARALAERLGITEATRVSFQSRLGPHAVDQAVHRRAARELGEKGEKRLAVMCPAFVADCLETLEEIGIARARGVRARRRRGANAGAVARRNTGVDRRRVRDRAAPRRDGELLPVVQHST